jgi:hypothetical protein
MNENPDPVFCGQCQHYMWSDAAIVYEGCAAEKRETVFLPRTYLRPEHYGTDPTPVRTPAEKNAHNDCPDWKARSA